MLETLVTILHVGVSLFMILVILVQGGNSGGVGAAFGSGGGGSGSVLGATGATSLLGKLTYGAAAIFMISSVYLTTVSNDGNIGLTERLEETSAGTPALTPVETDDEGKPAETNKIDAEDITKGTISAPEEEPKTEE